MLRRAIGEVALALLAVLVCAGAGWSQAANAAPAGGANAAAKPAAKAAAPAAKATAPARPAAQAAATGALGKAAPATANAAASAANATPAAGAAASTATAASQEPDLTKQPQGPAATSCPNEIPYGVRIVKMPDAEQQKISLSEFSIAVDKDTSSYDVKMHVKNATDGWCVTSLAIVYTFGDARGQEWIANEYPAVQTFTTVKETAAPKSTPAGGARAGTGAANAAAAASPAPAPHSAGLSPGQDEERTLFDVYFYIQPRPLEYFDGFHLISAEIKSSLGYLLNKPS